MRFVRQMAALCALTLALSLILSGCAVGPGQESAGSAREAAEHFLTDLQNGEFGKARTYLLDGNPLLNVFLAEDQEAPVPEMEEVYRRFCEKQRGLTFSVSDEGAVGIGMVFVTAAQYDFASAIDEAMLEAIQTQCQGGGAAFADYAGWLIRGIESASMGAEDTIRGSATEKRGVYTVDHRSYTDHDLMNLITGGFYDYADLQMAECTASYDGVDHAYWFVAQGDEVIACVQQISEEDAGGEIDDETAAGLNEFYQAYAEQVDGVYMGVYKEGNRLVMSTGIDFRAANQNALVNAGLVSDAYKGNTVNGWLSLSATVSGFTREGMSCKVTPVYGAEE